ncbi:hypothetical protein Dimus_022812 [Dionaea muscipula]
MATIDKTPVVDVEQGGYHRSSATAADAADYDCGSSVEYSDAEDGGGSTVAEEEEGHKFPNGSIGKEIVGVTEKGRGSFVSECSVEVDLESGNLKKKVHLGEVKRGCRICQLSFDASSLESGFPMELGCSCKEDLAVAHKQCAEAWFKIRGNRTCEICGSVAGNIVGVHGVEQMEQCNEANEVTTTAAAPTNQSNTRNFWQGHRFLNFLLACMVFAFVICWLFHFNVSS